MEPWGPISFRFDSAPGANQIAIAFDSTRGPANMTWAPVAAGSAFLVPGPWRAAYPGAVIRYSILCTAQSVTLAEQVLTGSSNPAVAGDWETQGAAGAAVIAAGVTAPREFKPLTPDWRITLTAGGTGPTLFTVWGTIVYGPSYGG